MASQLRTFFTGSDDTDEATPVLNAASGNSAKPKIVLKSAVIGTPAKVTAAEN
jgi:hypothetical protein